MPKFSLTFPKVVIFDVYRTIMDVMPPVAGEDTRWVRLWEQLGTRMPPPSLVDFSKICRKFVEEDHAEARVLGVAWPEVVWPKVIERAVPAFLSLAKVEQDAWILEHQSCLRSVALAAGAADTLKALHSDGVMLGIASNAQDYTLTELNGVLSGKSISLNVFDSELCIWSYAHGFSKPDPYLFRILSARLAHRGVKGRDVLMVGDRLDNDIQPASRYGWQTWHLVPDSEGDWGALRNALEGALR